MYRHNGGGSSFFVGGVINRTSGVGSKDSNGRRSLNYGGYPFTLASTAFGRGTVSVGSWSAFGMVITVSELSLRLADRTATSGEVTFSLARPTI